MPHDPPRSNPADRLREELESLTERITRWLATLRAIPRRYLETAIRTGSVLPITRSEHYERATRLAIEEVAEIQIRLLSTGLRSGLREVGRSSVWARVAEIAGEHGAPRAVELIQAVDSQTRRTIRDMIRSASRSYAREPSVETLRKLVEEIRPKIGLTVKQARLIRNRRVAKLAKDLPVAAVDQEMQRQAGNMIRLRARAIGDRGVVESVGFARHEAFVEARDAGDLPENVMKWWQDQADDAVRPDHRAQTQVGPIPLDAIYEFHGVLHPPSPAFGCRCWERLWNPEEMKSFSL